VPYCPQTEEFRDLLQDLRLLCWETWTQVESDPECTFIYQFTCKIKGHLIRRLQRSQRAQDRLQLLGEGVHQEEISHLWVDEFLEEFEPVDREILVQRMQGNTLREIEKTLNIPRSSLSVRLKAIRERAQKGTYERRPTVHH
jgi:RNA polymerase sigma factor (sigma-70 family)